jgi:hypothetical protein
MKIEGKIFFSFCGVNPAIEKEREKLRSIRNLSPNSIIIEPDRLKINANYHKIIQGVNIIIVSELEGFITTDVREEVNLSLDYGLPVFVIRSSENGWLFHQVAAVKERNPITDLQFMNELVLSSSDIHGSKVIDPGLLNNFSGAYPELPLIFNN